MADGPPVGQGKIRRLFKEEEEAPIFHSEAKFKSLGEMFSLIDNITYDLPWTEDTIQVPTNILGGEKKFYKEFKFYYRNALDCVRALFGEPTMKEHMDYFPKRVFDEEGRRLYSEMSTGDWWWRIQEQLPDGATVIPIILGSDATKLTVLCGSQTAWPVYISIGNIHKDVRYKKAARSLMLIGFLPKSMH
jgi:Plavaka transposase